MTRALLLDEMLSPRIAETLRDRGIDAYGVAEREPLSGMDDAAVLELATTQGRLLVTLNIGDFVLLSRRWDETGRTHAGIVYVAYRRFPRNRAGVGTLVEALQDLVSSPRPDLPSPGASCFL